MSNFFRWIAALVMIGVSLVMTGYGTYAASAGEAGALVFVAGICGVNFMGVFLSAEMFRAWSQRLYPMAALLTFIVIGILGLAANQDQIALRKMFFAADDAQVTVERADALSERRIARAEQRVQTARAAIPPLERQVEVATEAYNREAQSGVGPRAEAALVGLEEANAALASARQDIAAAEAALAELLDSTQVARRDDAAIASQIDGRQRTILIWLGSILIETLGIAGAALLRLKIGADDDDGARRPVTTADLEAVLARHAAVGAIAATAGGSTAASQISQEKTDPRDTIAHALNQARHSYREPRSRAEIDAANARAAQIGARNQGALPMRRIRNPKPRFEVVGKGPIDIVESYKKALRERAKAEGADMPSVEAWMADSANDSHMRRLADDPDTRLPTVWFETANHSQKDRA